MNSQTYICVIPEELFYMEANISSTVFDIHTLIADAKDIEKRLLTGVNEENELARYSLCCASIEEKIIPLLHLIETLNESVQFTQYLPCVAIGADYIEIISKIYAADYGQAKRNRIGYSYYLPNEIETHLNIFRKHISDLGYKDNLTAIRREKAFTFAKNHNCGIVEIQDPFSSIFPQAEKRPSNPQEFQDLIDRIVTPRTVAIDELDYTKNSSAEILLRKAIQESIDTSNTDLMNGINFSNIPHSVISEVLNSYCFTDQIDDTTAINVLYTDGSQGMPIPIMCLHRLGEDEYKSFVAITALEVGLLSMRHLFMDKDVDFYWFRNKEVSKTRFLSDTDVFCYEESKRQFKELREMGKVKINLYHTGLQPAIIGFYRALVDELMYRRSINSNTLMVIPKYYSRKRGYISGQEWF